MPPPEMQTSAVAMLAWRARYLAISRKSNAADARSFLAAHRVPEAVQRAAIGAGSTGDSTLGGTPISIGAWSDAAQTSGAFYRILSDNGFIRLPWHARVGLATSSATAGVVAEGKSIPVSKITLNNILLTPTKIGALIVISDALLMATDGDGQAMFNRILRDVTNAAVDTALVSELSSGLSAITSTSALADVRAAMLAVASDDLERPYFIGSTDIGKLGSSMSAAKGGSTFAATGPSGGEIAGVPFLVSSGVPAGTLYYVNTAQVCANGEAPTVDVSVEADILMDTAPGMASDTPTAASLVNMYQTNSVAVKSTALVAFKKLRTNAAAVVSGISSTTWASV